MNGSSCNSRLLITGGHQLSFINLHRVGVKVTTVDYVTYCSVTKAPVPRGSWGKAPHILNFDVRLIGLHVISFKLCLLYQSEKISWHIPVRYSDGLHFRSAGGKSSDVTVFARVICALFFFYFGLWKIGVRKICGFFL